MAVEVKLPAMGDTVEEAEILTWLKSIGDFIEADDILVEVATDKVDTEVPAPISGRLTAIHAQVGETVPVGTVIAEIEPE